MRLLRRRPAAISCQELVELVTDYIEGTLPESEQRRFDVHIAGCDGCTNYLEQMRVTIRITGALRAEAVEPAARDALMGAFRDWRG